jgi:hypothetical protein
MSADTVVVAPPPETEKQLHSPPPSNKDSTSLKLDGSASESELSDLEDSEDDIGEVTPAFISDGGVPVFKPTMDQFKSFKVYVSLPARDLKISSVANLLSL